MANGKDAAAEPIIVVRRKGNEDEHHHGGVWKIAYADFMTAMMAFFLVMWLINASNTETKARVASYFNPIKLSDSLARKKGLRNFEEKPDAGTKSEPHDADPKEKPKSKKDPQNVGQNGERADPGEFSGKPASRREMIGPSGSQTESVASAARAREAGAAFQDPFNPLSIGRLLSAAGAHDVAKDDAAEPAQRSGSSIRRSQPVSGNNVETGLAAQIVEGAAADVGLKLEVKDLTKMASEIRRQAEAAVRQFGASGGPGIDVTIEGENIVLSLTDTSTFGMFSIGSTEPNADLVKLVQRIAPIILRNSERIIVRGHTDSRPFRADARNSNWRLAMGRAESAYAMLLRAGIDEDRFERIEGHADRKPKFPADPGAAANRRIDILMRATSR